MPANKYALIRYRTIDRCIANKHKPYPSMSDIMDACEESLGFRVSESTIQKDIQAMKNDSSLGFNAPIEFSRSQMGYYYSDPDYSMSSLNLNANELEAVGFASSILQQFKDIGIFRIYEDAIDKIFQATKLKEKLPANEFQNIIYFEKAPEYKGEAYIQPILNHIINKNTIAFNYFSFDRKDKIWHQLHPYVLKEYRNRWYVIGMHDELKEIRTFALDRILELKKGAVSWNKSKDFDAERFFQHSFGIYYGKKVEDVILSFTPYESQYIRTQPIHATQEVLIDNEEEYRIQIRVFIEYDLLMYIRSCGDKVKVIKPDFLKDQVIATLKSAMERYN